MEHRNLGRSGLVVSSIGLGCNNLGRPGARTESQEGTDAVVHAALDAGITFFDTADMYGSEYGRSEAQLGAALEGHRDSVVIATKFGFAGAESPIPSWGARGSRRYVRLAVEGSLRRLRTDWIDLYQLHSPDPSTPIEETLAALDELVAEGKIRYYGHSNFAAWQLVEAEWTARVRGGGRFVSAQNEYSLIHREAEAELLPALRHHELGFLPFFPLYNGLLTGKYTRAGGPADSRIVKRKPELLETAPWDALESYQRLCDEHGVDMLTATFTWLLAQPGLASVIAGATTPEQVRRNAATAGAWQPAPEVIAQIGDLFEQS